MKLISIKVYIVKTPAPFLGGRVHHFIKLTTDNGIEGWGETAVSHAFNGLDAGYKGMIEGLFHKFYEGKNPLDRECLFESAYALSMFQHPDFIGCGLLSALDIAVWDICGKYYNTPIYNLLGGKCRDSVRGYSYISDPDPGNRNIIGFSAGPDWVTDHEGCVNAALKMKDYGFNALKIDPLVNLPANGNPSPPWQLTLAELNNAEALIGKLRKALGDDFEILIGTHGQPTTASMVLLAKRLEQFNPFWLEEPVPPENFEEMARVAEKTTIPVASGERLATVHDFQKMFSAKAVAIAQPDLGSCGGITQAKKIATLAEPNYVLMAPHVYGGPIITAAALHVDMNIKNFLIQEAMYDSNQFIPGLIDEPFDWRDGYYYISDRPGLGVNLNEEVLEKYSVKF